jgi:hypothetical protein
MEALFDILVWLLYGPVFWFLQGLFAVLHPQEDPDLRRIQRMAGGFLLAATLALALFLLGLVFWRDWRFLLPTFAIWFLATGVGGLLGGCLERS